MHPLFFEDGKKKRHGAEAPCPMLIGVMQQVDYVSQFTTLPEGNYTLDLPDQSPHRSDQR